MTKRKTTGKKVCKNCEHFVQVSSDASTHIWGDCMKDAIAVDAVGEKKRNTFVWADQTCSDFRPKQELDSERA